MLDDADDDFEFALDDLVYHGRHFRKALARLQARAQQVFTAARSELELSQDEMARRLDMYESPYRALESGGYKPSAELFEKLHALIEEHRKTQQKGKHEQA